MKTETVRLRNIRNRAVSTMLFDRPGRLRLSQAAAVARTAQAFKAHVTITTGPHACDAAGIIGLLGMGIADGTRLTVRAEGEEAARAVRAVTASMQRAIT